MTDILIRYQGRRKEENGAKFKIDGQEYHVITIAQLKDHSKGDDIQRR